MVAAEDLLRHAVGAAEVAPVGDGDPQVAERPAKGVESLHTGDGSEQNRKGKGGLMNDKAEGKLKEAQGKLTGDKDREAEGKAQNALGKAKDAAGQVLDAAGDKLKD